MRTMPKQNPKKLRRKQAEQNLRKKQSQMQFTEKEKILFGEIRSVEAIAITNQQNVVSLNKSIREISDMAKAIDHKLINYDQTEIQPRLKSIEDKLNILVELMLPTLEEVGLTEEQMKTLDLEVEPEERAKPPKKPKPKKEKAKTVKTEK